MSKSTFFKRIAVTAIAALGFGMLSVAPSNAAVTSHALTIDAATDSITLGDTATAVLTHSFVNLGSSYDSVSLQAIVTSSNASTSGTIMLSVTDSYTSTANDATSANSPRYSFGNSAFIDSVTIPALANLTDTATIANAGAAGAWYKVKDAHQLFLTSNFSTAVARDSITISGGATDSITASAASRNIGTQLSLKLYNPTAAGTYVVSVFTRKSDAGAALSGTGQPTLTWTVTVTEPSRKAEASSTVTLRQGDPTGTAPYAGTAEGTDSQTIAGATASTTDVTAEFSLFTLQKSAISTNTAQESYTVTVTGQAYVSSTDAARPTANTGVKYLTMAHTNSATVASQVYVWSTGTAGTATITVTTVSGLVLGTKTVSFYDDVATLAVSTALYQNKIIRAGGFSSGAAFFVTAKDSAGNAVQDVDPTVVSSDVSVITGGTCTDASSGVSDGTHTCSLNSAVGSVSGGTATITIRTPDPAVTTATAAAGPYISTTYVVTLGGSVSTEVITLDKTSYDPSGYMVITVTAKDSSGNPVWDGATAPTLSSNKALGGTITMTTYVGGVSTSAARSATTGLVTNDKNLGAPAASGSFMVSGISGNAAGSAISVSGTVGDDAATAAANAASDAAAEAIDAANAATDAANLAAEAADAATVAAEEARDAADAATAAVEALATEVATLMAALKAQITTLANVVAKIAKRTKS
jgi:trimeric autotransporter adhesin